MCRNTHIAYIVVILGLMVFLLRPYVVYRLTANDRAGSRIFSSLQRMVKKKDEHHASQSELSSREEQRRSFALPLRRLLVSLMAFLLLPVSAVTTFEKHSLRRLSGFSLCRYALTSCLLI